MHARLSLGRVWRFVSGLGALVLLIWIVAPVQKDPTLSLLPKSDPVPEPSEPMPRPVRYSPRDGSPPSLDELLSHRDQAANVDADSLQQRAYPVPCAKVYSLAELRQPPPDSYGWGAIQHTPTGRLRLGRILFQRLGVLDHLTPLQDELVDRFHKKMQAAARTNTGVTSEPVRDRLWPELAQWWDRDRNQIVIPPPSERQRAMQRFLQLTDKARTAHEDEELWKLVVTCGRDWLRIPFDSATERFDLNAELPVTAPETAWHYSRQMYWILFGREWEVIMVWDWEAPPGVTNPSPQEGGELRYEIRSRPRRPGDI